MYGTNPGTSIVGGAVGTVALAQTGGGLIIAPVIIAVIALATGALLLLRAKLINRPEGVCK